jgi:alginate O-acetyltransferase complex protein AlgI
MLFPTGEFAVFFIIAFFLCWFSAKKLFLNKVILLGLSYFFYAWWDYRFCFLLAGSSFANYSFALLIQNVQGIVRRKIYLTVAIVFNLGLLGFFKYFGFFQSSLNDLLGFIGLERELKIFEVMLPVGVSFFTFQGISYVVDVFKQHIKASDSPVDVLLYNSFFPHLVAGPIVRAKDFLPQLKRPLDSKNIEVSKAFILIGTGLFKKVVLAHILAVEIVGPVFESPKSYQSVDLLLGMYAYAFQIYFDFSAYSDIAIGLAYLLGFEFKPNFKQPYKATSLSDFWKRWHISLSSFLRDYLYIPLGGSRGSTFLTYRNLIATMVLGGLWHGASWNFVIWGLIHGLGLVLEKEFSRLGVVVKEAGIGVILRRICTFHFVCLAWIFFNADSLQTSVEYLKSFSMISIKSQVVNESVLLVFLVCVLSQAIPERFYSGIDKAIAPVPVFLQGAILGYWTVFISALSPGVLAPFIYFKF